MAQIIKKNNVSVLTFFFFLKEPLIAAVSGRPGGVSEGPFSSLNMGFSVGDDESHVVENRKHFFDVLGAEASQLINCRQVHGVRMEQAGRKDCGRGALSPDTAIADCDGLYTNEPGVPLTMNFADCVPLLLYDPVTHSIALAHGGWRGSAGNIGGLAVQALQRNFGAMPENIKAAIGPAIQFKNFEVGEDVIKAFRLLFSEEEMQTLYLEKGNGKYLFDLPGANRALLIKAGVLPSHIEDCHICTYGENDLFYSYRRAGGITGRHMAVMMLK